MARGLAVILYSLGAFPTAGLAWVLMWVTDRLYEGGWWWIIAMPIRIITFIMQIGVLLGCLATGVGIVLVAANVFYRASRGQDSDNESTLSVKGYMGLLLLPVAMGVASLLVALFNNWLNFGERGLGLITMGYVALNWVLEYGSFVIIGVWLVILPIFLNKRNAISRLKPLDSVEKTNAKSSVLGVLSLLFGIIGIFWWPAVLGIIAVILGIVQLTRRRRKLAIAGLVLGIIDILLAVYYYIVGLMPSIF